MGCCYWPPTPCTSTTSTRIRLRDRCREMNKYLGNTSNSVSLQLAYMWSDDVATARKGTRYGLSASHDSLPCTRTYQGGKPAKNKNCTALPHSLYLSYWWPCVMRVVPLVGFGRYQGPQTRRGSNVAATGRLLASGLRNRSYTNRKARQILPPLCINYQ